MWLFLTVPRVCLQFVNVIFPDHTHSLFSKQAAVWFDLLCPLFMYSAFLVGPVIVVQFVVCTIVSFIKTGKENENGI